MDAIVLFSHGSLLCGFGEALRQHAARLRERGLAPMVEVGYLNYSEPLFAETAARCAAAGATRIVVTPYFLVPGHFVNVSLPGCIDVARNAHPDIAFVTAAPIGFDERLAEALIASAQSAFGPERWRDDLKSARKYCTANPRCPLFGSPGCQLHEAANSAPDCAAVQSLVGNSDCISLPELGAGGRQLPKAPLPPGHPLGEVRESRERGRGEGQAKNRALLVMVHGSPRESANADMFRVLDVVRERNEFPIVEAGFMECNSPSIPEAIDRCIAAGAAEIVATPYFLHTGTHVADDLPTLLEEASARYPRITFRMSPYLGLSAALTDILADRTDSAL